jgi:hypothetical protein
MLAVVEHIQRLLMSETKYGELPTELTVQYSVSAPFLVFSCRL